MEITLQIHQATLYSGQLLINFLRGVITSSLESRCSENCICRQVLYWIRNVAVSISGVYSPVNGDFLSPLHESRFHKIFDAARRLASLAELLNVPTRIDRYFIVVFDYNEFAIGYCNGVTGFIYQNHSNNMMEVLKTFIDRYS